MATFLCESDRMIDRARVNRRRFLVASFAAIAAPLTVQAQPAARVWRIGVFHLGDHVPSGIHTLRDGLKVLGYEEGKNIQLDFRNLNDEQAVSRTAKEFVQSRVDLIVAFGNPTVRAARAVTSEIPIVMLHVTDPVEQGFVKTLARPGGNTTGFVFFAISPAKHIELFNEMASGLRRVLVLVDPRDPATPSQLVDQF